jgi:WD40 repeat protein
MTAEEALAVLDALLSQERLSDVQEIVFRRCWEGQTYAEIAETVGYDTGYIKDVGAKLWQFLSGALGEKVTKNNVQAVLRRQALREEVSKQPPQQASPQQPTQQPVLDSTALSSTALDSSAEPLTTVYSWGDAIDVSAFCGREAELKALAQWLVADRCRVVSLLGMGGIGKTSLSVKLAQQLDSGFRQIIWRSLRNGPDVMDILADWLHCLMPALTIPEDLNSRLNCLIQALRTDHCLLILDNAETILQGGEYSGYFRAEHEGYSELLKRLAELPHQSCLLITSRESPRSLMILEGETSPVRAMRLSGIGESEAREILQAKGNFVGTASEWQELIQRYAGNPLALKVVATTIQELFEGDIAAFLAEGTTVFDDIRYLLRQQFERLSSLEQGIMYWLAIHREPMAIAELQQDLIPAATKSKLIEAINILRWRSLIDKTINHYTQQPVVMEYVTERLIERFSEEIINNELHLFIRHALIKAPIKDYVRDSQIQLILQPVLDRLLEVLRGKSAVEQQLGQILEQLQTDYKTAAGYAGGNLLNLFRQLKLDLTEASFAELAIWQAYLQDVPLHQVDFSHTDIRQSVFAQTLGSILSVVFSPDGQLLASSDAEGEICLWQVADGKQLFSCKDSQHWVWSVCFSPDSQMLASSSEDKILRLWDVQTSECFQELVGHTNWIYTAAFHPNKPQVASGSEDQTIKIWDIQTGECLITLSGHQGGIRSLSFAPNGQTLVSSSSDQTVRLWDIQTGEVQVLTDHTDIVRSVTFSPDGQWLATCSDDQTVRLWQVQTGKCIRSFICESRTWSVAFSPDSQFLLTGSDDQTLRLWEIHTETPIRLFEGHTGLVLSVAFSPDGRTAASGSDDQTIKFWEVDTGRCLKTLKGHNNWVWSVAFSPALDPNRQQLASGNEDRTIRLWEATGASASYSLAHHLEGHTGRIWSIDYSPGAPILASGSDDQTIRFWQTIGSDAGRCLKILRGQTGAVRIVKFSPDGAVLASNSGDDTVKLWDVSSLYTAQTSTKPTLGRRTAGRREEWVSGQCLAQLEGDFSRVFAICFHPTAPQIATGSDDNLVHLWDTKTGTWLNSLSGHTKPIESLAFSPDGTQLASGSTDQTVRFWDSKTGKCLQTLTPEVGRVLALSFSSNGQLAISGSNPTVVLWDATTQQLIPHSGHTKTVPTLAFSADGTYLATGSEDETIRLWHIQSAQLSFSQLLRPARPYEGLNLTGATGLTAAQKATLMLLGAVED